MKKGVSVKLFLTDGTPEGLKLIEKSNWTGIGLMCSRSQLADVQKRAEVDKPCVYVLTGRDDSDGQQRIYIGEAEQGGDRIAQHAKNVDFWTHLILFTSKDSSLNKAHVKYLESRLIGMARDAKRVHVENKNHPLAPQLAEADIADVESFLADMLILYPLLGLNAFEAFSKTAKQEDGSPLLKLVGQDAQAHGRETADGLVVLEGARGRITETNSMHNYARNLRKSLIEKGVLRIEGHQLVFTQNYTFDSPSTAAMVVLGRNSNGRREWKTADGKSLKEIQSEAITGQ